MNADLLKKVRRTLESEDKEKEIYKLICNNLARDYKLDPHGDYYDFWLCQYVSDYAVAYDKVDLLVSRESINTLAKMAEADGFVCDTYLNLCGVETPNRYVIPANKARTLVNIRK